MKGGNRYLKTSIKLLESLNVRPANSDIPKDHYSEEGLIYRLYNYRHHVVHRNINPFHFKLSKGPKVAYFWLDPGDHDLGKCKFSFDADLQNMYKLVEKKCKEVLEG